jgi:hypothetical protein
MIINLLENQLQRIPPRRMRSTLPLTQDAERECHAWRRMRMIYLRLFIQEELALSEISLDPPV